MNIRSRFKNYSVEFIDSLAGIDRLAQASESYFVIDQKVYELYKLDFCNIPEEKLYLINAVETNKNVDTALKICEQMTKMPTKRNTHLISIGGGIVQDITGFAANILYRGIKWTFFPSTLLAACDSCIGGKTSLNYKGFKNLLGTFYPPDEIRIYTSFFKTLSREDFYSGLGEVIKFNIIAGGTEIETIEKNIENLLQMEPSAISDAVQTSLMFKKTFIEEDEFDHGVRILLNYAHTFGHAFETSSNYEIPHGSAVALGMVVVNKISVNRGLLSTEFAKRIEKICKKILILELRPEWFNLDVIIASIRKDKKQVSQNIRAILLVEKDISLQVVEDIREEEIIDAVRSLKEQFIM